MIQFVEIFNSELILEKCQPWINFLKARVYVPFCVCMHMCTCDSVHACVACVCVCMCLYVNAYVYVYVPLCVQMCVCMSLLCAYMYVGACACVYVHVCLFPLSITFWGLHCVLKTLIYKEDFMNLPWHLSLTVNQIVCRFWKWMRT